MRKIRSFEVHTIDSEDDLRLFTQKSAVGNQREEDRLDQFLVLMFNPPVLTYERSIHVCGPSASLLELGYSWRESF